MPWHIGWNSECVSPPALFSLGTQTSLESEPLLLWLTALALFASRRRISRCFAFQASLHGSQDTLYSQISADAHRRKGAPPMKLPWLAAADARRAAAHGCGLYECRKPH